MKPAGHWEHSDAALELNSPRRQFVQESEEVLEYVPASHAVHVVALVRLFVKKPAPHTKQEPVRACGAYFPYSHSTQVVPLKLYSPAEQSSQKVRSVLLSFPFAHAMQSDEPVWVLYCPALHNVHEEGNGAVEKLEYLPIAQSIQVDPS
jgi:hypothetical protein